MTLQDYYNAIMSPSPNEETAGYTAQNRCTDSPFNMSDACFMICRSTIRKTGFRIKLNFYESINPQKFYIPQRIDQFCDIYEKNYKVTSWAEPNRTRQNRAICFERSTPPSYQEFEALIKAIFDTNTYITKKMCGYCHDYSNAEIKDICINIMPDSTEYIDLHSMLTSPSLSSLSASYKANWIDYKKEELEALRDALKAQKGQHPPYNGWTDKTIWDNVSRIKKIIEMFDAYPYLTPHGDTFNTPSSTGGAISMPGKQTTAVYELLDNNKQLILTGAPGTGKTFTVKEYVKNSPNKFVQFHPSYDYTDFMEGLKPVPVSIGSTTKTEFVRIDGCFKAFCREIVTNALNQIKAGSSISDEEAFIRYKNGAATDYLEDLPETDFPSPQDPSDFIDDTEETYQYYFIIDEINRADLSKVFGEIMYCLDEDYRGPNNAIETQYSALDTYYKPSGSNIFKAYTFDCFKDGFFIPENLHIIGTMNDIDRSVESFDFALRRRFIWKEIDANESLDELESLTGIITGPFFSSAELISRAKKVNDTLVDPKYKRLGLTKQFQLGKAYYKAFDGTGDSLRSIYYNKVEPIIKEYTRGRDATLVDALLKDIWEILFQNNIALLGTTSTASPNAISEDTQSEEMVTTNEENESHAEAEDLNTDEEV